MTASKQAPSGLRRLSHWFIATWLILFSIVVSSGYMLFFRGAPDVPAKVSPETTSQALSVDEMAVYLESLKLLFSSRNLAGGKEDANDQLILWRDRTPVTSAEVSTARQSDRPLPGVVVMEKYPSAERAKTATGLHSWAWGSFLFWGDDRFVADIRRALEG
jgi:hypothetical protein